MNWRTTWTRDEGDRKPEDGGRQIDGGGAIHARGHARSAARESQARNRRTKRKPPGLTPGGFRVPSLPRMLVPRAPRAGKS